MADQMDNENRFQDLLKLATRTSHFTQEGFDVENTAWDALKVLVVGAGGLGCELLHCLALSGFTDIHVIDMDTIDLSNLNRQFLFRNEDIGKPKSDVAAAFINKRCPWVKVVPHFGRIENETTEFYEQFNIVILGLDSIHARTWINAKYASMVEYELIDGKLEVVQATPVIDGGTEGFKGSARVIQFGKTACINCTLYLFPPQRGVPMCTLENVPRIPAHCVLYVKEKTWGDVKPFGADEKDGQALPLDGDNPEHIVWIMNKAKARQAHFKLEGDIDFAFTQGVVKNVIPAVGFTNAMVAAMCVNEALKMATGIAHNMDCFAFYDGSKSGIASSVNPMLPDPSCPVCQVHSVEIQPSWTPGDVINHALKTMKDIVSALPNVQYPKEDTGAYEAQLYADLGDNIRVPLNILGPLAFKTEETKKKAITATIAEAAAAAGKDPNPPVFRLELNGGTLLGQNVLNLLAVMK